MDGEKGREKERNALDNSKRSIYNGVVERSTSDEVRGFVKFVPASRHKFHKPALCTGPGYIAVPPVWRVLQATPGKSGMGDRRNSIIATWERQFSPDKYMKQYLDFWQFW